MGGSELILRLMCWMCLKDDKLSGSQMCIVTGNRLELSVALINRIKGLISTIDNGIRFDTKETVVQLNGIRIEGYPSHHISAMRGIPNISFILCDEAAFWPASEQQEVRAVVEGYIQKSNPYLALISTANQPGDLFDQIFREPESECIYRRLRMDWTYGKDRIYSEIDIANARKSQSWAREMELRFLGKIGNTFRPTDIGKATNYKYDSQNINKFASKSIGLDPAWGSSNFGICITQLVDGKVQVLYAEEFERAEHSNMIDKVWGLVLKYDPTKIYIDGANPSFIRSLKIQISEDPEYEKQIEMAQHQKIDPGYWMKVLPVNFAKEHVKMLAHTRTFLENRFIAIDPRFEKLIMSLHTAVDIEGKLDKNSTSYNDIFDAFRLSLQLYQFT